MVVQMVLPAVMVAMVGTALPVVVVQMVLPVAPVAPVLPAVPVAMAVMVLLTFLHGKPLTNRLAGCLKSRTPGIREAFPREPDLQQHFLPDVNVPPLLDPDANVLTL